MTKGVLLVMLLAVVTLSYNNGLGYNDYNCPNCKPRPCLLYTSPSPRDQRGSRMPSSA